MRRLNDAQNWPTQTSNIMAIGLEYGPGIRIIFESLPESSGGLHMNVVIAVVSEMVLLWRPHTPHTQLGEQSA